MESLLLQEAVLLDKPVLGICRGIQFINAAFGGTLYQDLPVQHPSEVEHHQTAPYNTAVHAVIIRKETPLYDLLHQARIAVNSYHHQAVHSVAPGLEIMYSGIPNSHSGQTRTVVRFSVRLSRQLLECLL